MKKFNPTKRNLEILAKMNKKVGKETIIINFERLGHDNFLAEDSEGKSTLFTNDLETHLMYAQSVIASVKNGLLEIVENIGSGMKRLITKDLINYTDWLKGEWKKIHNLVLINNAEGEEQSLLYTSNLDYKIPFGPKDRITKHFIIQKNQPSEGELTIRRTADILDKTAEIADSFEVQGKHIVVYNGDACCVLDETILERQAIGFNGRKVTSISPDGSITFSPVPQPEPEPKPEEKDELKKRIPTSLSCGHIAILMNTEENCKNFLKICELSGKLFWQRKGEKLQPTEENPWEDDSVPKKRLCIAIRGNWLSYGSRETFSENHVTTFEQFLEDNNIEPALLIKISRLNFPLKNQPSTSEEKETRKIDPEKVKTILFGRVAVNLQTEAESDEFLQIMEHCGILWASEEKATSKESNYSWRGNARNFIELSIDGKMMYATIWPANDYKILTFAEFKASAGIN